MNKKYLKLMPIIALGLFVNTNAAWGVTSLYNPNLPGLTVISTVSDVSGVIGGWVCPDGTVVSQLSDPCGPQGIYYPISGPVYAATISPRTGETLGVRQQVGTITAAPIFSVGFFQLAPPDWSTLPDTLSWEMSEFNMNIGGSVFAEIKQGGMALAGLAYPGLRQVEDWSTNGYYQTLRMTGCMGIQETSGTGPYANKIGTLCLNGTFKFTPSFVGKGTSNCSIVLHDPLPSVPVLQ